MAHTMKLKVGELLLYQSAGCSFSLHIRLHLRQSTVDETIMRVKIHTHGIPLQ